MSQSTYECSVVGRSYDDVIADLVVVVSGYTYALGVGLLGKVTEDEAQGQGLLLVEGKIPMKDEDWCKAVRQLPLERVLPFLIPQS